MVRSAPLCVNVHFQWPLGQRMPKIELDGTQPLAPTLCGAPRYPGGVPEEDN